MGSIRVDGNFLDINREIQNLGGLNCWGGVGGPGTGSNLSFEIGKKIKLKNPLMNKNLSHDLRHFQGEYGFFIECSWRMEKFGSVPIFMALPAFVWTTPFLLGFFDPTFGS
jgi:hypothetical protein